MIDLSRATYTISWWQRCLSNQLRKDEQCIRCITSIRILNKNIGSFVSTFAYLIYQVAACKHHVIYFSIVSAFNETKQDQRWWMHLRNGSHFELRSHTLLTYLIRVKPYTTMNDENPAREIFYQMDFDLLRKSFR